MNWDTNLDELLQSIGNKGVSRIEQFLQYKNVNIVSLVMEVWFWGPFPENHGFLLLL